MGLLTVRRQIQGKVPPRRFAPPPAGGKGKKAAPRRVRHGEGYRRSATQAYLGASFFFGVNAFHSRKKLLDFATTHVQQVLLRCFHSMKRQNPKGALMQTPFACALRGQEPMTNFCVSVTRYRMGFVIHMQACVCQTTPSHSALRFSRLGSSCQGFAPGPQKKSKTHPRRPR
jgi:hypothetical protein